MRLRRTSPSCVAGSAINSRRHIDPIGVLYSPASMRVQWLLDRRTTGEDWSSRNASSEWQDDAIRAATRNFTRAIEHSGLQHRFVSTEEVKRGDLRGGRYRILMLPHTIALSATEAKEIRAFVEQGGTVLAEGEPGVFDEHGRRMAKPSLSEVLPTLAANATTGFAFGKGSAIYSAFPDDRGRDSERPIMEILETAGVRPRFPLFQTDGGSTRDVETHIFDNGGVTVVALQRDFHAAVDAESIPNSRETVAVMLPHTYHVYDLRGGRSLGNTDHLMLELGPVEPVLLALSEKPLTPLSISGPREARLGSNAEFLIHSDAAAASDVVHLDVIDPEGNTVAHYSGNLFVTRGAGSKLLPFAFNDKPGIWTIRARDLLNGATASAELKVER